VPADPAVVSSIDNSISAIIATLGRPGLLKLCLERLANQTTPIAEVVIVHCGDDNATQTVANDPCWANAGMTVRYFHYGERNCAKQRNFAIERATHPNLLLVDDDIEVEPTWAAELFKPIRDDSNIAATMGRVVNQPMSSPTFLWRIYRILLHGRSRGLCPGLMVGAALPNGFPVTAREPILCEWIGGGASAVRRSAFEEVGGFASFFTGSSPGEDLDLGYRLSRKWKVCYVPSARCVHHQASAGRETVDHHQYLSMRSRFGILTATMRKPRIVALGHIGLWAIVQCLSELASLRRGVVRSNLLLAWLGRSKGFVSCVRWIPHKPG